MARLWVCLMVFIMVIGWASADESANDQPVDGHPLDGHPLDGQLLQTPVRAFNPVHFMQQIRGFEGEIVYPVPPAPDYQQGDTKPFWVITGQAPFMVDAELRVKGQHALIWASVDADVSDDYLNDVARAFDEVIYPQANQLWGDIPELDTPIYILFARNIRPGLNGYFYFNNLYPAEVIPISNEHPMVVINLDYHEKHLDFSIPLIGHEYQHLIQFYVNPQQDTWMNEGLSTFFEYYLGYDPSYRLLPSFFRRPDSQLNLFGGAHGNFLLDYATGFLFVTYFYEQYGAEGLQLLYHQPSAGLYAVADALAILDPERNLDTFFADWLVANYLFNDDEWGYGTDYPPSPYFRVTPLADRVENTLPQYSAQYFNLRTPANDDIQITFDLDETVGLIRTDAPSGDYMWYGNRGDLSTMTLTRAFDLSAVANATLSFDLWHEIEEFWDYAYLLISLDDGETWEFIQTESMDTENLLLNAYGVGWTGSSGGWRQETIPLDRYVGQQIMIRFQYMTDTAVNTDGIAIDNIAIPEIAYFTDLEADSGDWVADGWIRMDNRLSQKAWVQAIRYGSAGAVIDVQRWLYPDETEMILQGDEAVKQVVLIVSPFAQMTTIPASYRLSVQQVEPAQ